MFWSAVGSEAFQSTVSRATILAGAGKTQFGGGDNGR
jgi:hypothetical protein